MCSGYLSPCILNICSCKWHQELDLCTPSSGHVGCASSRLLTVLTLLNEGMRLLISEASVPLSFSFWGSVQHFNSTFPRGVYVGNWALHIFIF